MSTRGAPQVGSIERRSAHTGRLETRGSGGVHRIGGIGIPVGVTATIGGGNFTEEVDPSALDDVLGMDVRCLLNHQPDQLLGRTTSKTLQLKKTSAGLDYTCTLPETRADVWESVQRGDLTGSSWSFTVAKDEWTRGANGVPHRRILRFASVLDCGPVVFEAYTGGATVSARCVERVAELAGVEARFVPPSISMSINRDRAELRRLKREAAANLRRAEHEVHALDVRIVADTKAENEREIRLLDARLGRSGPGAVGRERRLAAVHEAAHALGVVLENGTIVEVTLTACRHGLSKGHHHRGALLHLLGAAAENLDAGRPGQLPARSSGDWRRAAEKLRALGLDPEAWIPRELRYGESVARFYWEPIEALAELLYRKGHVSGREAEGVLSRAIADQTQRRVFSGEEPRWGPLLPPSERARR